MASWQETFKASHSIVWLTVCWFDVKEEVGMFFQFKFILFWRKKSFSLIASRRF